METDDPSGAAFRGTDRLVVRRATDRDAAAVAGVWLRSFDAALPDVRRAHTDRQVARWVRDVVIPCRETWVATVREEVVGVLVLDAGELEQLYLDPSRRGRGIGDRLVALAKRRSPRGLSLWTFRVNEPARRFYERHGFREVGRTDGSRNEEREPDVRYAWRPEAGERPAVAVRTRVLTADDWREWRELRLAALADAPHAFRSRLADWQGAGDREERWRTLLDIPGAHCLVADVDGVPAGMARGVSTPDGDGAELHSVWIAPGVRGLGVADRLVEAVEEWARRAGAGVLRLSVVPGNEHAAGLYRRHGFEDAGPVGEELSDGRREHVMAKRLRPR